MSASNPTRLFKGVNTAPAIYELKITGTAGTLTPFLLGNTRAIAIVADPNTGELVSKTKTLNLNDPDSLMVDPQGDLVLTNVAPSRS